MSMQEAIDAGADAFFDEKYGETVRTVRVEGFSHELCGGTRCRASGQIGGFVMTGERSMGSGMRRIEAVTGEAAEALVDGRLATLEAAAVAGVQTPDALPTRITELPGEDQGAGEAPQGGGLRPAGHLVRASWPRPPRPSMASRWSPTAAPSRPWTRSRASPRTSVARCPAA